jgi:hypothetical protein
MHRTMRAFLALSLFLVVSVSVASAQPKAGTVVCVGLYSETAAGSVSTRVGTGDWAVVKVGDVIPADAEIRVNVDRDWIEVIAAGNPGAVYEIAGDASAEVVRKVPEILKGKPRAVTLPAGSADKPDARFKDKLVVSQYLGRQIWMMADGRTKDIKYGDVLDNKSKVTIIAINNTITLMNAAGAVTTVIGPLRFEIDKVLKNENLYRFLNVPR